MAMPFSHPLTLTITRDQLLTTSDVQANRESPHLRGIEDDLKRRRILVRALTYTHTHTHGPGGGDAKVHAEITP